MTPKVRIQNTQNPVSYRELRVVKSQLSEYELLLLFYNCIWIEGGRKEEEKFRQQMQIALTYGLVPIVQSYFLQYP